MTTSYDLKEYERTYSTAEEGSSQGSVNFPDEDPINAGMKMLGKVRWGMSVLFLVNVCKLSVYL